MADAKGMRKRVQARVYSAPELDSNLDRPYGATPMADYFTVTLRLRKGQHIHLKFATREELDRWQSTINVGADVECEGCLHTVDNKRVLIDITAVKPHDNALTA